MKFFIPFAPSDERAEHVYGVFAEVCGVPVPRNDERIWAIHWTHDGDDWLAEVGEQLKGRRVRVRRRKGGNVQVVEHLSDPATVLAIFPGETYWVVTNGRPIGPVASAWEGALMTGHPTSVRLFDD